VRFQERLLRRVRIGPVERRPTAHRAHREHLQPGPLAAQIGPGLIPVHLSLLAQTVALRHERLAPDQAHGALARADMVAHRGLSHGRVGKLGQDPAVDAPCRVPLLAWRPPVAVQHLVDERGERA